jgi:uncharacterized protein YbjT (DUF2867 family)
MTILVTGATGNRPPSRRTTRRARRRRARTRPRSRQGEPSRRASSVVQGDLLDVDSLRSACLGVSTLFLLNAVVADEFTQALIALNVAREPASSGSSTCR